MKLFGKWVFCLLVFMMISTLAQATNDDGIRTTDQIAFVIDDDVGQAVVSIANYELLPAKACIVFEGLLPAQDLMNAREDARVKSNDRITNTSFTNSLKEGPLGILKYPLHRLLFFN